MTRVGLQAGGAGTTPGAQLVHDRMWSVDGARVGHAEAEPEVRRRRRPWRANQPLKTLHVRGGDRKRPEKPGVTSLTAALQWPSMAAFEGVALHRRGGGSLISCGHHNVADDHACSLFYALVEYSTGWRMRIQSGSATVIRYTHRTGLSGDALCSVLCVIDTVKGLTTYNRIRFATVRDSSL